MHCNAGQLLISLYNILKMASPYAYFISPHNLLLCFCAMTKISLYPLQNVLSRQRLRHSLLPKKKKKMCPTQLYTNFRGIRQFFSSNCQRFRKIAHTNCVRHICKFSSEPLTVAQSLATPSQFYVIFLCMVKYYVVVA